MPSLFLIKILLLVLTLLLDTTCWQNGIGRTPPLGWSSRNVFECNINETLIKKQADLIVSRGLAAKGYTFVNLDDCWQENQRDANQRLTWDKNKFPNGIPALSQYIHAKGLKFGIYSDAGMKTCQGRPGSYLHQDVDARTFSEWEVDFLKYDNCENLNVSAKVRYPLMTSALTKIDRKIFFSMSNEGEQQSYRWAEPFAHSWRTTSSITNDWQSIQAILDRQASLSKYAGPGGWNDPDILQVGNGGMTYNQSLAHFAMWSILKAPLLISCNLESISSQMQQILTHQQLIALNQDSLGIQAQRLIREVFQNGIQEIWSGPVSQNRQVVAFLNRRSGVSKRMEVNLKEQVGFSYRVYTLRDVIKRRNLGTKVDDNVLKVDEVAGRSIVVYLLKGYQNGIKTQLQE